MMESYRKNHAGEEFAGTYELGDIHGEGYYKNEFHDTYVGHFEYGLRHGRGKEYVYKKGKYTGFYVNGTKTGKGELDYVRRRKKKDNKKKPVDPRLLTEADRLRQEKEAKAEEDKLKRAEQERLANMSAEERAFEAEQKKNIGKNIEQEFKYRYQGYILSNEIANGGIRSDTIIQIPKVVAKRDHRIVYPIKLLFRTFAERAKLIKRKIEKYTDMEHSIRREMETKKVRIFKQQKHYTKKAIELDEKAERGIPKNVLKAINYTIF